MTITLDIPPEMEGRLLQASRMWGQDVPTLFLESVKMRLRPDVLSAPEARLFEVINAVLPPEVRLRRDALLLLQEDRELSEGEREELIRLIDEGERLNADRWKAIADLAFLREVSPVEMARSLGFPV